MQTNNWGRFLTITSYTVKQPVDGLLLSNSVRSAVTGLARTLANEYAAFGITVNNVCPGYTRTDRLGELVEVISKRTGATSQEVLAGWSANSRWPHRHATGICGGGDLFGFRARQLRERHFHRHRWRDCPAACSNAMTTSHQLLLTLLPGLYAVARYGPHEKPAIDYSQSSFCSFTKTDKELSVVCESLPLPMACTPRAIAACCASKVFWRLR